MPENISNKISVLIPARGGSKSIPFKNIKTVHGHPLIAYTIIAALKCKKIKNVIVSTDCHRIANISKKYGAKIPFMRPDEISQDDSICFDTIKYYFEHFDEEEVIYFRPTSPLRDISVMDNIIDFYFENKDNCTSLRSVNESNQPPYKLFKKDENGFCQGFFKDFNGIEDYSNLPRQTFPKTYTPNGYIDICKKDTLYNLNSTFGKKILMYITEHIIDIDTQVEFDILDYMLSKNGHDLLTLLNTKHRGGSCEK